MNQVCISGNLTRDAELKYLNNGAPMSKFGIAVNERYNNRDYVNFFDCAMFGKYAETMNQYLTRGTRVCLVGKLKQNSWENRETGKQMSRVEIMVNEVYMAKKTEKQSKSNEQESQEDIPF